MRMTLGQLRRLLLREMKLGIAGAQGDARHWGKKPLPDEPIYSPPEGGETYIATDLPDFDPGPEIRKLYDPHRRGAVDWAGDPIAGDIFDEPEEPTASGERDVTRPAKPHRKIA